MGNLLFYKGVENLKSTANNFYELRAFDIDGQDIPMSNFKEHKLLLIVNVASACTFTKPKYN